MKVSVKSVKLPRVNPETEAFKRAADAYLKKATSSKQTAREALVAMGIYTPTGKLTKAYR